MMKIDGVNVYKATLPFTGEFSISQVKGFSAEVVVVESIAEHGELKGFGEGAPMAFVTGETPESTSENIRLFTMMDSFPWELDNVSQIWDFVESLPSRMDNSAAVAALEISLLDLLGKKEKMPVIDYFPKDYFTDTIHYGATITLGDEKRLTEICEIVRKMGINVLRIKMCDDLKKDKRSFEIVRSVIGSDCDLRIDPNRIWDRDLTIKHMSLIREYNVKVVEEPMVSDDIGFGELVEMITSTGAVLMACESAPTLREVKKVVEEGYYQLINVKLSRSGGFRRALKSIDFLRNNGVSFQIGCSLGESGILSAAGRTLCLLCRDAVYYDGSYDRFLLAENTTLDDVSFGQGGIAGPLDGVGLGVEVSGRKLDRLSGSERMNIKNPY